MATNETSIAWWYSQINQPDGKPSPLEIRLEYVSYRYPGAETDTLHDMNLTITSEQWLAVIGLNGARKATLVKLICGLIDPKEGTMYCNGIDIRAYNGPLPRCFRIFSENEDIR